eukprot:CAMPEP_0117439156 /NCGR_PEP_ID=MMETSP0759-20121206/2422_1 /TAXON_ID=63605 /ORGANISM="Percolomonas cosmopolitus, Strain WS" /LENGTH=407 /DNA_ID=CAMNT_0005230867 /DNA_START=80 /DNA_END=1304 /DNA_ORIENTATION=+
MSIKSTLNSAFSYSTVKIVTIRDARLGIIHRLIQLAIFTYIVGFVIIWQQQYLETESSMGTVLWKVKGTSTGTLAHNNATTFASSEELINPPSEVNALFLATREGGSDKYQIRGECASFPAVECDTTSDCPSTFNLTDGLKRDMSAFNGKCVNRQCIYQQWCPQEHDGNFTSQNTTQMIQMNEVDDFTVWFKASIQFPHLAPSKVFSTIKDPTPRPRSLHPNSGNLFTIAELLAIADEVDGEKQITTYGTVKDKGCVLRVSVDWSCNLDKWDVTTACDIRFNVLRLDSAAVGDGFNFRSSEYYRVDGVENRDLTKYTGVRMILTSKGVGYKFSLSRTILQLSSGLALMVVATTFCDFLLQYIFPERQRYKLYKRDIKGGSVQTHADMYEETDDDTFAPVISGYDDYA